ncbi:RagB/SusD family nutrient uptake outer membrane protein [Pedobacter sp. KR3-3]|uniref:RagB/SusD family nutrient uptake outer membrane protein n=1 Tax=Pedobacter albus TaxID=3113905 RepID=A0ABU7IAN9_9SPHI|nr:RagB/SusD family nutrient uptake outer membrane protein [Pedobacter sp. KR3-3]MEE1946429.1 RagB/SusD family nutrient uptake outer membrane protein [Pedobacter sp. KR3-3]
MKKNFIITLLFLALVSCKKQDEWLDKKSDKSDVVPTTLADLQTVLDNDKTLNEGMPALGILGSDNMTLLYTIWLTGTTNQERGAYIFDKDIYKGELGFEWNNGYQQIAAANIVLEGLAKIDPSPSSQGQWNALKGAALAHRSIAAYNLLQEFAKSYDQATAATDPGIILKNSADVNEPVSRASVAECYARVITDLKEAEQLLPILQAVATRPSKTAVQAMLAKTYLLMGNYALAKDYATSALTANGTLADFNTLNAPAAPNYSMPAFDKKFAEIIFYSETGNFNLMGYQQLMVAPELYRLYGTNDLRKNLFFEDRGNGNVYFRGQYTGSGIYFSGLATNELYLIRAECQARLDNKEGAAADLNALLVKRCKTGTYGSYQPATADEALKKVLEERRKELPFTGNIRWEDLRRLNHEPGFAKTVTHVLNGQSYILPPNDKRYVLPIPDDEIRLSGIAQNER